MYSRGMTLALVGFAVACLLIVPAMAATTLMGNIENVEKDSISVKATDGEVQTFKVETSARITLDGKRATLDDLKTGDTVMVTTKKKNDVTLAVAIAARTKA